MADSTKRSSSARSKSGASAKSGGSAKRSGSSATAAKRSSSSSRAKAGSSRSSGSRSTASKNGRSSNGGGSRASSSGNGVVHNVADTVGSVASKAKAPLVAGGAAAAGLIGGLVLGSRVLTPRKKVFGVPISRKGLDLKPVAKEVGKAGKQIGRLTNEMAQARKQAKKVGDALK